MRYSLDFKTAGALTKSKENQLLSRVIDDLLIDHPVARRILRNTAQNKVYFVSMLFAVSRSVCSDMNLACAVVTTKTK